MRSYSSAAGVRVEGSGGGARMGDTLRGVVGGTGGVVGM